MESKILLIIIFVAVQVNYLRSVKINICRNDNDVLENARQFKTQIVPVLLIRDINQYPINGEEYTDEIIKFYREEKISNLLVVPVDTCEATHSLLKEHFNDKVYPRLYYLNNNRLIRKKWTDILQILKKSLEWARKYNVYDRTQYNFDHKLNYAISQFKNIKAAEEREAANMRGDYGQPIQPLITQVMIQPAYPQGYLSGTVAQKTTGIQHIAMTNQLPILLSPGMYTQPFVQTERSNPSTTFAQSPVETQSNLSRRGRLYRQTDLPQTSVNIRSTGMTQPATYVGTTVGPSTAYSPNTTWTTSAGTLVGEQPLGSVTPQTLDLFRDEPSISQPKPLETQDLLGTLGQHQEKDQNHEVGSDRPSTQLGIYFSDEGGSSKRPRMK